MADAIKNRNIKQHILWLFLAAVGLGIILWKVPYGFGGDDETFYLTIPHRFLFGDTFIRDEWHLSQLSAFLNIPFVWIYHKIVGSMTGIVLAARYYYALVHFVFSALIYYRLRKYGTVSVFAGLVFLIFVPFNISAFSYNSMGVDFLALAGVLMAADDSRNIFSEITAGVFFAFSVLCCPYLAVAYVIYFICVITENVILKKSEPFFEHKSFIFFTAGVFLTAAAFAVFFVTRGSLDNIGESLRLMLDDPEHSMTGLDKIKFYFTQIFSAFSLNRSIVVFYALTAVIIALDRNRKNYRAVYLPIIWLATALLTGLYTVLVGHEAYNAIMFAFALCGGLTYIFIDNKPSKLFCMVYLAGIVYSAAVNYSSNVGFYVIAMAMTVSDIASCIFIGIAYREMKEEAGSGKLLKAFLSLACAAVIAAQISVECFSRAVICFWDFPTYRISEEISDGPAKGLVTTEANRKSYDALYSDMQYYADKEKGRILCLTPNTVAYLIADMPYGTFSAWTSGVDETAQERLISYYELNGKNAPLYVYLKKEYYSTRTKTTEQYDFTDFCKRLESVGYRLAEQNDVSLKYEKVN